jgi:phosphoenolpyruvate synthase/pyruvate phosphate dikinase
MRARGEPVERVEAFTLERLANLRSAIEGMPLLPEFVTLLRSRFSQEFGTGLGATPIFVRSDTNMEDLEDFTGAGLNLTVPNVLTEEAVLQAIRRVWASPYRERGYRWRQKYL